MDCTFHIRQTYEPKRMFYTSLLYMPITIPKSNNDCNNPAAFIEYIGKTTSAADI